MYEMSPDEQAEIDAKHKQWELEAIQKEKNLRTEIITLRGEMLSIFTEYVEKVREEEKMGFVLAPGKRKQKNLINAAVEEEKKKYHKKRDEYLNKYVEYDGYWMRKKKKGLVLEKVIGPIITIGLINIIQSTETGSEKSKKTTRNMMQIAEKEKEKGTAMCRNFGCGEMLSFHGMWKQPTYRHVNGGMLIKRSPQQPDDWNKIESWKYPTDELPELDEEWAKNLVKDLNYEKRVAAGIRVGPEMSVGTHGGRKRTRRKKRRRRIKSTKKKRKRKRKRTKKKRKRRRR